MWRSYLTMAAWAAPVAVAVAVAVYIPLRIFYRKKHAPEAGKLREACMALLVVYLAAMAALVFSSGSLYLPKTFTPVAERLQTGEGINLVPFYTLRQVFAAGIPGDMANLAANVAMFIPLGFLLPFLFRSWRRWHKTIPLGLAVSVFIEFVQLFIGRSVDVDDVLLNTLGAALGYGVWRLTHGRTVRGRRADTLLLGCTASLLLLLSPLIGLFLLGSYAFAMPLPVYPLEDIQPGEVAELWLITGTPSWSETAGAIYYTNDAGAIYQNRQEIFYSPYGGGIDKNTATLFYQRDGESQRCLMYRREPYGFGSLVLEPISYPYYALYTGVPTHEIVEEGQNHIVLNGAGKELALYLHTGDIKNPDSVKKIPTYPMSFITMGEWDFALDYLTPTLIEVTFTRDTDVPVDENLRTELLRRWQFNCTTAELILVETVYTFKGEIYGTGNSAYPETER